MGKLYKRATSSIVLAGLIAGTADALAAMIVNNVAAMPMFRFIASGAFGMRALAGGLDMALAGALFHYLIAFFWTVVFYFAYPRLRLARINPIVTAVGYGLLIWLVMNLIVVPISRAPQGAITFKSFAIGAGVLMVAIGLPIAWIIGRHYSRK